MYVKTSFLDIMSAFSKIFGRLFCRNRYFEEKKISTEKFCQVDVKDGKALFDLARYN
jgi:hypothetical protein